jgi:hypothetical protein
MRQLEQSLYRALTKGTSLFKKETNIKRNKSIAQSKNSKNESRVNTQADDYNSK